MVECFCQTAQTVHINPTDAASLCAISRLIIITYFALKELIIGNNQLFFLCCFGNIFYVSQQLVLIEELKGKIRGRELTDDSFVTFTVLLCKSVFWAWL